MPGYLWIFFIGSFSFFLKHFSDFYWELFFHVTHCDHAFPLSQLLPDLSHPPNSALFISLFRKKKHNIQKQPHKKISLCPEHTHKKHHKTLNQQKTRPKKGKKKKPQQSNMKQKNLQKYLWINLVLAIYCWAWSLPLSVVNIVSETPLKKTNL